MSAPASGRVTVPTTKPPKRGWFLRWHQRVLGFCLVIFAFEVGIFLVVFPWLQSWELNWIPVHSPTFSDVWLSRYFRGLVSGIGLLDIYIASVELVKQCKALFHPR